MPFNGRPSEGKAVVGHFRKPSLPGKLPVLLAWGGLDYYKEDAADLFAPVLDKGAAILAIDIPGTADAPVLASADAPRAHLETDWAAEEWSRGGMIAHFPPGVLPNTAAHCVNQRAAFTGLPPNTPRPCTG